MITIKISRLRLRVSIGVSESERATPQEVAISLQLDVDADGGQTGRLADTLDYKKVCEAVRASLEQEPCMLLESLGCRAVQTAMRDTRVMTTTVEVAKLRTLRFTEQVSVVVRGTRESSGNDAWNFV